jgi:hypothetical protein
VPNTPTISPTPKRPKRKPTPIPTFVSDKPSSYIEAVEAITRRRLNWDDVDSSDMTKPPPASNDKPKSTTSSRGNSNPAPEKPPRGASSDPVRNQMRGRIDQLRSAHKVCPLSTTLQCFVWLCALFLTNCFWVACFVKMFLY